MSVVTILNAKEKKTFESPPVFTGTERKRCFTFPVSVLKTAEELRTPTAKVCFLTVYGYFKVTNKFFNRQFHQKDLDYVAHQLSLSPDDIHVPQYQERLYRVHKTKILELCGIKKFDDSAREAVTKEVTVMVRSQLKPRHIFQQVLDILLRDSIEVPSYHSLVEVIGGRMGDYKKDLVGIVQRILTDENRDLLDGLFEKEHTDGEEKFQRYKLTLFKKYHQSTKPAKVKANTEDLSTLSALFHNLEQVIAALDLTDDGIEYYAQSVLKFQVFQMLRRSDEDRYLHVIAFIVHQYFKLQDGLVDTLIQVVQKTANKVSEQQKTFYFEQRGERQKHYNDLADYKRRSKEAFEHISAVLQSSLTDAQKLAQIKAIIPPPEQLLEAPQEEDPMEKDTYYAFLKAKSLAVQKRVSDIIRKVEFQPGSSDLMKAVEYYKVKNSDVDKHAPIDFLEAKERELVFEDGKFQVSLYKVLFFQAVCDGIKAGALNLQYSYRYRSLDDYVISEEDWEQHKAEYLKRAKLEKFADVDSVLKRLSTQLHEQYLKANTHILSGENKLIKFHHGTFSLITPPEDASEEEQTLADVFPKGTYVSLLEVLSTANACCHFLDKSFNHFLHTNIRQRPSDNAFFAGLIGLGCNLGLERVAQVSPLINPSELDTATTWYFSLENINNSSDDIISFTDSLDLPNIYRRKQGFLHTSSDGQKRDTRPESLNASPSYKYFGQRSGGSIISFIDERHLLFHGDVINSADREALYDIDGLMHDNVLKSDMHSVDMHGFSETIFGATNLLGFYLAPRLKRLGHQHLYAFEKRKVYEDQGFKILPQKYANETIIREQWDDMLRLAATIKLKITPASQIFKRFNSYTKQHKLYQALKAYGRITKTLFILTYIDDVELRQAIEKQLNKVEHSQKFASAVYYGGNQEFLQATKEEQQKTEACKRLIQNAIILWNYLYLSKKIMDENDEAKRKQILKTIQSGSVVTWSHVHLHGEYDFSEEKLRDSIGFNFSQIQAFKLGEKWEEDKEVASIGQATVK